jgi:hypothetical protein
VNCLTEQTESITTAPWTDISEPILVDSLSEVVPARNVSDEQDMENPNRPAPEQETD